MLNAVVWKSDKYGQIQTVYFALTLYVDYGNSGTVLKDKILRNV